MLAGGVLHEQDLLDEAKILFSVDADCVVGGGFDVNLDAVFEEAELFETLGALKLGGRERWEKVERRFAIGVKANVLPVKRGGAVAVVGDGGSGEVEGAPVGGGDDFYGIGIGDVFRRATHFEGGHIDVRVCEGMKQGGDVFWGA